MSESGSRGKRGHSQVRRKVDPSGAVSVNIHEPVAWAADTISSPLLDTGKGKGKDATGRSKKVEMIEIALLLWHSSAYAVCLFSTAFKIPKCNIN